MNPKDRNHYEDTIARLNAEVKRLTDELSAAKHETNFLRMTITALSNPHGMDRNTFRLAMQKALPIAEEDATRRLYFAYNLYKQNFLGTDVHERMVGNG